MKDPEEAVQALCAADGLPQEQLVPELFTGDLQALFDAWRAHEKTCKKHVRKRKKETTTP